MTFSKKLDNLYYNRKKALRQFFDNIVCGDNVEVTSAFSENSIDLVVTSPPYDDLRDYDKGFTFDLEGLVTELYRVMSEGGVIVWVVNDATINGSETGTSFRHALRFIEEGFRLHDTMIYQKAGSPFPSGQHSVRYTQIFEYMFIFSKGRPKTINLIQDKLNRWAGQSNWGQNTERQKDGTLKNVESQTVNKYGVRNNIWKYNTGKGFTATDDYAHEHPAPFPEDLARDHILTWTNEGDIVYDPFVGSGTVPKIATLLDRIYIGCDVSEEYVKLTQQRLASLQEEPRLI